MRAVRRSLREQAKTAQCLSNLRTIGQGLQIYAHNNRQSLPYGDFLDPVGGSVVATAAVALARLGVPVSFIGRVGDDAAGRVVRGVGGAAPDANAPEAALEALDELGWLRPAPGAVFLPRS